MNYKIRPFDLDKDREIILEYDARATFECETDSVKNRGYKIFREEWLREKNAERLWELVVEAANDERNVTVIIENDSNEIIGFFWTMIDEIYPNTFCMQINDIYIEENYRRHGIARDLFCYAENHARKHNIKVMRSGTGISNQRSQNLHEKTGFAVRRIEYEKLL